MCMLLVAAFDPGTQPIKPRLQRALGEPRLIQARAHLVNILKKSEVSSIFIVHGKSGSELTSEKVYLRLEPRGNEDAAVDVGPARQPR